jgi:hypothetical protein
MCAHGCVYVFEDVIGAQGCGYMCSRMYIVCVRGCDVFEDWYMCSRMWVYVFEDWYMCSGMCIVCVQSVNGVLKVVNVCSRMCICVRGCDRCSKV